MSKFIDIFTEPDFIESLKVMGKGMLAIFIVIALIMLSVMILNMFSNKKK